MAEPVDRGALLAHLIEVEHWRRAAELAGDLVADNPADGRWHRAAGQCALHLDDADRAHHHLVRALALTPDDHLAHYFLSHAHRLRSDMGNAEDSVRQAVALAPGDADYWTELGWLAFERGDYPSALRCGKKAREIAPDNSRASTLLAAAETQVAPADGGTRGDAEAQIASLQRTLAIDPDNDAAIHNIGVVYFNELRDYRSAERCFRHALSIAPAEPLYRQNLSRTLRRQDPISRALYAPWVFATGAVALAAGAWRWRWRSIAALPIVPAVLATALLVATFWVVFLWPPAAVYDLLTRSDTMAAAGKLAPRRARRSPLRWPRAARLALFLAAFSAFWLALIAAFQALAFRGPIAKVLVALVAVWLLLATYAAAREWLGARERRTRRRALDLLEG